MSKYSNIDNNDQDTTHNILMEPYLYVTEAKGKNIRDKLIDAFNFWLNCDDDKLNQIKKIITLFIIVAY